jgi:hypothetical protein
MSNTSIRTNKPVDPIWRHIWIDRIGKGLWLVYTLVYLCIYLFFRNWESEGPYFLLLGSFNVLVAAGIVFNEVRQERYWRRIGERRSTALHDPTSFRASNQPLAIETGLQFPVTIRLSSNTKFIASLAVSLLVFITLCVILGFYLGGGISFNWPLMLLVLGIFVAVYIVLLGVVYFVFLRAQAQSIELTEEGITTRYLGHKGSLRWEDVHIFAQYPQGVANKAAGGLAFELSNEHTVVRWSQQRVTLPYFKVQSNQNQKDDFDWLVGRVNAYIIQRTGLLLLDFKDQQAVPVNQQGQQNDPLTPHLKLNGQQLWSIGIMCLFGIAIIVLSLSGHLLPADHVPDGLLSVAGGFLLVGGILIVAGVGISLWLYLVGRRYWQRLRPRRSLSQQDPTSFHASIQPTPIDTPPQPGKLTIQVKRSYLFSFTFGSFTIIVFLLLEAIFRKTDGSLLIIILVSLVLSLFSSLFGVVSTSKRNRRLIEIGPNGITSRINIMESHISWPDVRRFTRYRGLRLSPGRAKLQIYELAGDHTVVRWHWLHTQLRFVTTDPPMTPDEYEHWMTQVTGYVIARTGLPLLDLDDPHVAQRDNVQQADNK